MDRTTDEPLLVPISALQHYAYCPRQCALIHVEQTFEENIWTQRGRQVHENAHERTGAFEDDGIRVERALPLWSERLGLIGQADVVEFRENECPKPVEYKSGKLKKGRKRLADAIQLCAQALCLEEMFGREVPDGEIYYVGSKRTAEVGFSPDLRAQTEETAFAVRRLMEDGAVPPPVNDARCAECSLYQSCLPEALSALEADRTAGLYDVEGMFNVRVDRNE